jgi:hypothetical protein
VSVADPAVDAAPRHPGRVVQADAPHEDRASVLSLNALRFRLAFVVCGPAVGALVDRFTLEATLGGLAVVSLGSPRRATAFSAPRLRLWSA